MPTDQRDQEAQYFHEQEKKKIHVVLQDKCTKCGTCLDVCPAKFGAVVKLSGEPVPPPLPEDQRDYVKPKKKKA